WAVTGEKVLDSLRVLTRPVPGTETFYRFDRLTFRREGLSVTATHGSLFTEMRAGRVEGFTVAAADLAYDYVPPLDQDRRLLEVHRKSHREDLLFKPQFADVDCDPVTCRAMLDGSFTGLRVATQARVDESLRRDYRRALDDERRDRRTDPF